MDNTESEIFSPLPPILCNNPRRKIWPEKISLRQIYKEKRKVPQELETIKEKPREPAPLFPLNIGLYPDGFCFSIDEDTVIYKLRIWNPGDRTIYVKYSGLWGESARLGASWRCYPHTRFRLAPGLDAVIFVKATPRENSPIPFSHSVLKIASAHLRDNFVGYFMVPIVVKFQKYVPPCVMEEE